MTDRHVHPLMHGVLFGPHKTPENEYGRDCPDCLAREELLTTLLAEADADLKVVAENLNRKTLAALSQSQAQVGGLLEMVRSLKAHHLEWHPACQRKGDIDKAADKAIRAALNSVKEEQ